MAALKGKNWYPPSMQQYSSNRALVADGVDELDGHTMIDLKQPKISDNVNNTLSTFAKILDRFKMGLLNNITGRGGSLPSEQAPPFPSNTKESYEKNKLPSTPCIPIFETTANGTAKLTIPPNYSSTEDDNSMTLAGVYVERVFHDTSGLRMRRQRKPRKRFAKKNLPKTVPPEDDSWTCLVMESSPNDCLDYDDAMACSTKSCLSISCTTSSAGSFYDALQASITSVERSSEDPRTSSLSTSKIQQETPAADPTVVRASTGEDTITDRWPTCDKPIPWCGIFKPCNYFPKSHADEGYHEFKLEEGKGSFSAGDGTEDDNCEDEDSQDETGDDEALDYNFEDESDDDIVFFCEDYDESDHTNVSSGFDEKKVTFCKKPVVHVMHSWDFAYRQARKGEWEMAARDRERFRKRIADLEAIIGPALQPTLRDKVYRERFSETSQGKDAQEVELS